MTQGNTSTPPPDDAPPSEAAHPLISTLMDIARKEREAIVSVVPADPVLRFIFFMDLVRAFDFMNVSCHRPQAQTVGPAPDFSIMEWGWNTAAAHLLCPFDVLAIPIHISNEHSLLSARAFLHQCGRSVLMQRAAAMIHAGLATAEQHGQGLVVRVLDQTAHQFLDLADAAHFNRLCQGIRAGDPAALSTDWAYAEFGLDDDPRSHFKSPGRVRFSAEDPFAGWIRPDILERMEPVVKPWGRDGNMIGYASPLEVEEHFLATALQWLTPWRSEAGLHPGTVINGISAEVLIPVAAMVMAYHLAHIQYVELGVAKFPRINAAQSLPIWSPKTDLVGRIQDHFGFPSDEVSAALDIISLKVTEAPQLDNDSNIIAPLLIDLGNGLLLRPVSGVFHNPLVTLIAQERFRDPQSRNRIQKPREQWMRSDLYAEFAGDRYVPIEANIAVDLDGQNATDIDAAVFDRTSGELALFQLKWQDYHTNDVRQRISRARNLADKVNAWAAKLNRWCQTEGFSGIARALRLDVSSTPIRAVYLFGLSRGVSRVSAYGSGDFIDPTLAMANWPQLQRLRYQIGPAPQVFRDLHRAIRNEHHRTLPMKGFPFTVKAAGISVHFENLWQVSAESD